jgi:ribosome biogenesis GTPase
MRRSPDFAAARVRAFARKGANVLRDWRSRESRGHWSLEAIDRLGFHHPKAEEREKGAPARPGRVIGHLGVAVELELDDGERLRHRVARNADIVVGDRILVDGGRVVVEERRSTLIRRAAHGARPQVLAANVDELLILVTRDPPPRVHFIDRAAVMARVAGIRPRIVVTKLDLPETQAFVDSMRETYRGSIDVTSVSTVDATGTAALAASIPPAHTVVFIGPSGVGKSTLTNLLCPRAELATGALSDATGRGKHTTTKATLSLASGGFFVVDMPGIRDFGLTGLTRDELAQGFPGFEGVVDGCRYRDCLHKGEPGCAVAVAAERGLVRADRLATYRVIADEVG